MYTLMLFSAVQYYYPPSFLGLDLVTIFCYLIIDLIRLILGKYMNIILPITNDKLPFNFILFHSIKRK
jgi:hypothetical protein